MVEQNNAGTYQEILYSPIGKLALMNRQITQNIFLPLPGGEQATYTASTIRFRHYDWLGSSRFESNTADKEYADLAYAPFGETYSVKSAPTTPYISFTGQQPDTVAGLYDFTYREYSPNQGRWISPDPAGTNVVNFSDPQSFNRYAYVENSPLNAIDPLGLACYFVGSADCTSAENIPLVDGDGPGSLFAQASDGLFAWMSGGIAANPAGTPRFTVDGVDTPPSLARAIVGSGAGAQCPNNDCLNTTLQSDGFYRLQVSLYLVMNCYGSSNNCDWSHWSSQFIAGLNDSPFDFSSYYASYAQGVLYERNYMSPQDLQIRTIANRLSVPFMTSCEALAHGTAAAAIGIGPFAEGTVAVAAWTGGVASEGVAISVCE